MYGPQSHATEIVALLSEARAVGVWGNHDIGLCHQVSDDVRRKCPPPVLDFMRTLQPHLELGDCLFSHVEPWLDPCDVAQIWNFAGPPDTAEQAGRSFAASPKRFLFLGHFHRWLLMTPTQLVPWAGEAPVRLDAWERCLVVIAPVLSGNFAIYDTESTELMPLRC
jgi:hypothetical protein